MKEFDENINITKKQLITLCQESGILEDVETENILDDDMIETGLIDSVGVVCLQDQIKSFFNVSIELDQFIGECHTFNKLIIYLSEKRKAITS